MLKSIMIVGVGGQGTLLASRIIGNVLLSENYDVKVSEVHGMSQRGGSVVTYVKYGDKVYSPVVGKGEADLLLSFEILEAQRWIEYLKPTGKIVVNCQQIDPMSVIIGDAVYPDNVAENLRGTGLDIEMLDALSLAEKAGSAKAVNVVLIGALARSSGIGKEKWIESLRKTVPAKFLDMNLEAFELGYNSEK